MANEKEQPIPQSPPEDTPQKSTPGVVIDVDVSRIDMHYPKPTPLSRILKDVAYWSEWNFIISPDLDRHMQIFAPKRVDPATGMGLFQAALESVDLRMIHLREDVVKISKKRKELSI